MSGLEDIPENYAEVSYVLIEQDGKTILEVTQGNIKDETAREHSEQNWQMIWGGLKKLLEEKELAVKT